MPPDKLTHASNTVSERARIRGKRPSDKPGYISPYKSSHRPVTSALSLEEHATLTERAAREAKTPGQKATEILRAFLHTDDFEDATLVYGDGQP